ncbi:hypothetical protein RMCBS344292_10823 [Rhizopus microsporus]|nr:hypothetical protein RMCBS344292_10823 [Rhizopus microsporus]
MTSTAASDDEMQCSFEYYTSCGNKKALQNHKYQHHNESYNFNYTDSQGNVKCVNIDPVNNILTWKFCHKKYKLADAFRKHIFGKACNINDNAARAALEGNDSDDDSISGGDDTVHVALGIVTITLSIQEKEEHNNTRHGYKTAILSAFNALNQPDRDREKKKKKL